MKVSLHQLINNEENIMLKNDIMASDKLKALDPQPELGSKNQRLSLDISFKKHSSRA